MSTYRRRVHRAPNFAAFLITGAVIGFVVGALFAIAGPNPTDQGYGSAQLVGYIGFSFAAIGAVLAGVGAVMLDRRR